MTCIERKREAAKRLDDRNLSKEEIDRAKEVLFSTSCHSCSNPLVLHLQLDDLLCEAK